MKTVSLIVLIALCIFSHTYAQSGKNKLDPNRIFVSPSYGKLFSATRAVPLSAGTQIYTYSNNVITNEDLSKYQMPMNKAYTLSGMVISILITPGMGDANDVLSSGVWNIISTPSHIITFTYDTWTKKWQIDAWERSFFLQEYKNFELHEKIATIIYLQ